MGNAPMKISPATAELLRALPPVEKFDIHSLSCLYGADQLAAAYCGLKKPPKAPNGQWQHGWIPQYHATIPRRVICGLGDYRDQKETTKFFVARKDQKIYLQSQGYRHVEAIGLPVSYLPPVEQDRLKARLLVLPVHSIETTTLSMDFESYADAIDQIRGEFEEVVVCVHPSCFSKGYWVDSFEKRGFPVITGANLNDRKGLHRMQRLMQGFEFLTSNGFGSFLAYGAYFGASVSIYGPESEHHISDYSNLPAIRDSPEDYWKLVTHAMVLEEYPFLGGAPWKAEARVEWGRHEVGADRKPTPVRLRELFGWTPGRVWRAQAANSSRQLKSVFLGKMGHARRMLTQPEYRLIHKTLRPSEAANKNKEGKRASIRVGTQVLDVPGGNVVRDEFVDVFVKERYRLFLRNPKTRMIDGYARAGLLMAYFRREYPEAEVICFEPRPVWFDCLRENAKRLGIPGGCVVHGLPGKSNGNAYWLDRGVEGNRMLTNSLVVGSTRIECRDLAELLDESVGFLRLELTDMEIEVLEHAGTSLRNVEKIVIEYVALFGREQRIARLLQLLSDAGFRLHIREKFGSISPLFVRCVDSGDFASDHRLQIFGFR